MNVKLVRFFLLASVVVIWGFIILKIIKNIQPGKAPHPESNFEKLIDTNNLSNDTFELIADYPDPFTEKIEVADSDFVKSTKNNTSSGLEKNGDILKSKRQSLPSIFYYGIVSNVDRKKFAALISIDGDSMVLRPGQTKGQLKLLEIKKTKIIVLYKGKQIPILYSNR